MNINKFLETLPIMGKGMLGIFIVCLIIILVMYLLSKIQDKKN